MRNILCLRIVLTGLAMEFVYGIYISFIRWYEPTLLSSLIALGTLMATGGYLVGRKAKSQHIIQGALVGMTGVLFYAIITAKMVLNKEMLIGRQILAGTFSKNNRWNHWRLFDQ